MLISAVHHTQRMFPSGGVSFSSLFWIEDDWLPESNQSNATRSTSTQAARIIHGFHSTPCKSSPIQCAQPWSLRRADLKIDDGLRFCRFSQTPRSALVILF